MGNLSEFLMEELNVATAFTIPIFGGIEVAESTVISWVIMAIIVILTLVLTRNMRVEKPGKLQVGVEYAVTASRISSAGSSAMRESAMSLICQPCWSFWAFPISLPSLA